MLVASGKIKKVIVRKDERRINVIFDVSYNGVHLRDENVEMVCKPEDTFDVYSAVALACMKMTFGSYRKFEKEVNDCLINIKPKTPNVPKQSTEQSPFWSIKKTPKTVEDINMQPNVSVEKKKYVSRKSMTAEQLKEYKRQKDREYHHRYYLRRKNGEIIGKGELSSLTQEERAAYYKQRQKEMHTKWLNAHKDEMKEYRRKYREKNKERIRKYWQQWRKAKKAKKGE